MGGVRRGESEWEVRGEGVWEKGEVRVSGRSEVR